MQISHLVAALKQIEGEIFTDRADILAIIEDPSVVNHDLGKGIGYTVHEKLHHLGNHLIAFHEGISIYNRLTGTHYKPGILDPDILNEQLESLTNKEEVAEDE